MFFFKKKGLNSNDQQFHQYQQNKQLLLILNNLTQLRLQGI